VKGERLLVDPWDRGDSGATEKKRLGNIAPEENAAKMGPTAHGSMKK